MDAFIKNICHEVLFVCDCGFLGFVNELSETTVFGLTMDCCPDCKNVDIRVKNKE